MVRKAQYNRGIMNTRIAAALAIATLSFACQRETAQAPPPAGAAQVTTETVIATQDASTAEIDVKIPLVLNAVAKCEPTKTSFAQNEPIVLTLDLNEVPEGLVVSAHVRDGEKVVAHAREVANGRTSITLRIEDVPPGVYKLEALWGGNIVCEHAIEVVQ